MGVEKWPILGCKVGQNDLIVMKLKSGMSCHLPDVYTRFKIHISKHVEKISENIYPVSSPAELPFRVCGHQKAKYWPTMTKISTGQDTCCISVFTKSEGFI